MDWQDNLNEHANHDEIHSSGYGYLANLTVERLGDGNPEEFTRLKGEKDQTVNSFAHIAGDLIGTVRDTISRAAMMSGGEPNFGAYSMGVFTTGFMYGRAFQELETKRLVESGELKLPALP
jgi:hypothetical protein